MMLPIQPRISRWCQVLGLPLDVARHAAQVGFLDVDARLFVVNRWMVKIYILEEKMVILEGGFHFFVNNTTPQKKERTTFVFFLTDMMIWFNLGWNHDLAISLESNLIGPWICGHNLNLDLKMLNIMSHPHPLNPTTPRSKCWIWPVVTVHEEVPLRRRFQRRTHLRDCLRHICCFSFFFVSVCGGVYLWNLFKKIRLGELELVSFFQMGVSKNSGTPKLSILIRFSIINHPFWGNTVFGNTQMVFILDNEDQ